MPLVVRCDDAHIDTIINANISITATILPITVGRPSTVGQWCRERRLPLRPVQQEFVVTDAPQTAHPECAHASDKRAGVQYMQTGVQLLEQFEEPQEYLPSQPQTATVARRNPVTVRAK